MGVKITGYKARDLGYQVNYAVHLDDCGGGGGGGGDVGGWGTPDLVILKAAPPPENSYRSNRGGRLEPVGTFVLGGFGGWLNN